ncbi:MAG TPA: Ig-like domain repeat protein [Polyangiaceae bacterium]
MNGTIVSGSTSRLALDKTPSVCGTAKPFPGTTASTVRYAGYIYQNRTAANACVNVTITATSGEVQAAAYLTSFGPGNPALNYLGDPGSTASALTGSSHPTTSFAINVPSLAQFDVVVQETVNGAGATFSLDVEGCGEMLVRGVTLAYGPVDGGESVSVSGAGFLPGATVTLGGTALSSTNVTDTTITGVTGAHAAGAVDVVVTNPDGTSSTLPGAYTYMNRAPSSVTLAASPTSSVYGQSVSLTATVSGSNPPATANGTVTFFDGSTVIGTALLAAGGVATFSLPTLAAGTHSLSASFDGGTFFAPSTSSPLPLIVALGPTVTTLMTSNSPVNAGTPVVLTATVKAQNTGAPTGTVVFSDGNTVLGSSNLAMETARWTSTLTPGDHTIHAVYQGDANFAGSDATQDVQVEVGTSIVNLSVPSPVAFGDAVTAVATPLAGFAGKAPTGTVTFFLDIGAASQVVPIDAQGNATAIWNGVVVGTWMVTAQYAGDTWNGPASASTNVTVQGPTSTVTIASSENPAPVGSTVLITISVNAVTGGVTASGSVDVFDSFTGVTTTLPVTNGRAVYTMADPAAGDHLLEVSFDDPLHNLQPSSNQFTQSIYVPQGGPTDGGTPDGAPTEDAGPPPSGDDAGPGTDSGPTAPGDAGTGHDAGHGPVTSGGDSGDNSPSGNGDLPPLGPVASSGCACDVTGGPGSSPLSTIVLGMAALGIARRRRVRNATE